MHNYGFTLIELLITLVLILILGFAFLPTQKIFLDDVTYSTSAIQLLNAIRYARGMAITTNTEVLLCPSNAKGCANTWRASYSIYQARRLLYTVDAHASQQYLHWRAFPQGRINLIFSKDGNLNAENGTFWLCVTHKSRPVWAIVLNQIGRAKLILPNEAGVIILDRKEILTC